MSAFHWTMCEIMQKPPGQTCDMCWLSNQKNIFLKQSLVKFQSLVLLRRHRNTGHVTSGYEGHVEIMSRFQGRAARAQELTQELYPPSNQATSTKKIAGMLQMPPALTHVHVSTVETGAQNTHKKCPADGAQDGVRMPSPPPLTDAPPRPQLQDPGKP